MAIVMVTIIATAKVIGTANAIVIVIITIHFFNYCNSNSNNSFFFRNDGEGDQLVECASQKETLTKDTDHSMEDITTKALPDKVIALLEKRSKGHSAIKTF